MIIIRKLKADRREHCKCKLVYKYSTTPIEKALPSVNGSFIICKNIIMDLLESIQGTY
jgi:hypothetical protein